MLSKDNLRLPTKGVCSLTNRYCSEMDVTQELEADGVQYYKKKIILLR